MSSELWAAVASALLVLYHNRDTLMKWLLVATICTLAAFWSLEQYIDERDYRKECRRARSGRLRKMYRSGQVVTEEELEQP